MTPSTDLRRRAIGVAILTGCTVAAITLLVTFWQPLSALDQSVSDLLNGLRSETVDRIMIILTSMADTEVLLITDVAIVLLLLAARHWRTALAGGLVFASCALSVRAIKWAAQRERPVPGLYDGISAFSFPSGHAANVAAMVAVLVWLGASVSSDHSRAAHVSLLLTVTALIGLSRIYLHAHWPSDVFAGYLLALCVASMGYWFVANTVRRPRPAIFQQSLAIWIAVAGVHAFMQFSFHVELYLLQH